MTGDAYCNEVAAFDRVEVWETDGGDSDAKFVSAVDYIFKLLGNWSLIAIDSSGAAIFLRLVRQWRRQTGL